jgi:integrase
MKSENYDNKSGKRVWLDSQEINLVKSYYRVEPRKEIAISLMIQCGLRASEVVNVKFEDIRQTEQSDKYNMLKVTESKTGERETPIPKELSDKIRMMKNTDKAKKSDYVVGVSKRQVQRYVTKLADKLSKQEAKQEAKQWKYLTAHDLRRTWATQTYWTVEGDRAREAVMSWGGWSDTDTFINHYLGTVPDSKIDDLI